MRGLVEEIESFFFFLNNRKERNVKLIFPILLVLLSKIDFVLEINIIIEKKN